MNTLDQIRKQVWKPETGVSKAKVEIMRKLLAMKNSPSDKKDAEWEAYIESKA